MSGSIELQTQTKIKYSDILKNFQDTKNSSTEQIEKDLYRSFPGHPFFETGKGIQSLRNVLTAYSWVNPAVGYTQSMNFWVGMLLLFLDEEV